MVATRLETPDGNEIHDARADPTRGDRLVTDRPPGTASQVLIQVLLFAAGLVLLVGGGEGLVRGSAQIAARVGVSPIVVGLTVVAFGTSAPELAVSVSGALAGSADITFGNVIGSNIANVGLLLGMTALLRPLAVHGQIVGREIPMMLLCSVAAVVLGLDAVLQEGPDRFGRGDGAMLLLLFCIFLYYTAAEALRGRGKDPLLGAAAEAAPGAARPRVSVATLLILVGLGGLICGGALVVDSAVAIARSLKIPETTIGATIVAVGTSLPELVTSVVAARRGMHDLAVGNIVGSNIFNLLFVLGTTAVIQPIAVPAGGWVDLVVMLGLGVLLLPLVLTHKRMITRGGGVVLLAGYGGYVAWQVVR